MTLRADSSLGEAAVHARATDAPFAPRGDRRENPRSSTRYFPFTNQQSRRRRKRPSSGFRSGPAPVRSSSADLVAAAAKPMSEPSLRGPTNPLHTRLTPLSRSGSMAQRLSRPNLSRRPRSMLAVMDLIALSISRWRTASSITPTRLTIAARGSQRDLATAEPGPKGRGENFDG
jgi:hypothetical protein